MKIGARIKELREENSLSMKELGKKIDVSDAAICKWENGIAEPKASYLEKLSQYFCVSADYLLGRTDELGAVLPSSYTPPLTAEEQRLLNSYRALDPRLQTVLWTMIDTWQKPVKSEIQKNKA